MVQTVDISIPVSPEAAARMNEPGMRERVSAAVNRVLAERGPDRLFEIIEKLKATAHARGLTDSVLDEELAAWNAERRDRQTPPTA